MDAVCDFSLASHARAEIGVIQLAAPYCPDASFDPAFLSRVSAQAIQGTPGAPSTEAGAGCDPRPWRLLPWQP